MKIVIGILIAFSILFIITLPNSILIFGDIYDGIFKMSDSEITAITDQAISTKNISLCERLPIDKGYNNKPQRSCIFGTIMATGDTDLCMKRYPDDGIDSEFCIQAMARSQKNPDICNAIQKLDWSNRNANLESVIEDCYKAASQ